MLKKILPLFFTALVLNACTQASDTSLSVEESPIAEDETVGDTSPDTNELSYRGLAQFISKENSIPCADAAYDNAVCMEDPNGKISWVSYYVRIPSSGMNAELLSYLNDQNESMVNKLGKSYDLNIGCKADSQIQGDLYSYENEVIDTAFNLGASHVIDFKINLDQKPRHGDYSSCLSLITEFNLIQ